MTPNAFTLGNTKSYEEAFDNEEGPHEKLGQDESYEGGIVFRTHAEASQYLAQHPEWQYSVYGLVLPNGWDEDVRPILPGEDHHRLLNNAVLVRLDAP